MPDPMMMSFTSNLSRYFLDIHSGAIAAPELDSGETLGDNVRRLGLTVEGRVATFLDAMPRALSCAIVASVQGALADGSLVQVAWLPGYEFELTVSHVQREAGLLTLVIRSPLVSELQNLRQ